MQNKEFEKQVQQKMEELKLFPTAGVWNKVEAALPKERKRRWLVFFFLFAAISTAALLWLNNDHASEKNIPPLAQQKNTGNNQPVINSSNAPDTKTSNGIMNTSNLPSSDVLNRNRIDPAVSTKIIAVSTGNHENHKSIQQTDIPDQTLNDPLPEKNYREKYLNQPTILESLAKMKMTVQSPDIRKEEIEKQVVENSITEKNKPTNQLIIALHSKPSNTVQEKLKLKTAINPKDKADSSAAVAAVKQPDKKRSNSWEYGIQFGFGIPYTMNGINNTVFTTNTSSLTAAPVVVTTVNNQPATPSPGMMFQTGVTVEKNLVGRLNIKTGLTYMFLSNNIQIGNKIDSLSTNGTTTYNNGNGISPYNNGLLPLYNNHFRFIQLPLVVQFNIIKKEQFSLFLEGGASADFLINSNALLYNGATNTYYTNKDLYNRVVYTGLGGIGVKMAQQTRIPVSLGYQFNYGLKPFFKNDETQKHLPVSLVYFRLYLHR